MVWDLRGALLKKEEFESARLATFDFKQRVRAFRLLAQEIGADPAKLAARTVHATDDQLLAEIAEVHPELEPTLAETFTRCQIEARRQLVSEIGDPTPTRLL